MRPDHRLSPKARFAAVMEHMYGKPEKKGKPARRKRPPCNAWGKRQHGWHWRADRLAVALETHGYEVAA